MISVRSLLALCFAAMFVGTISAANAAVLITIDKSTRRGRWNRALDLAGIDGQPAL